MIFCFKKFQSYLIGSFVIVYTSQCALKHLLSEKDAQPRLVKWILLLQEFDCEIKDKKGSKNLVAGHLPGIIYSRHFRAYIFENFPNEQLFPAHTDHGIANIVKYLVFRMISKSRIDNDKD